MRRISLVLAIAAALASVGVDPARAEVDGLREVRVEPSPEQGPPDQGPIERLEAGDVLDVTATGFGRAASGVAYECIDETPEQCGPRYPVQFDAAGRARFQFRVAFAAETDPGRCRPDATACRLVVAAPGLASERVTAERRIVFGGVLSLPTTTSVPDRVAAPRVERAAAEYAPMRLALGLAIAGALLGLAAVLWRRTDWSALGEEAAPEIDDAEYADLDAIVAALGPDDTDDERQRAITRR